MKNPPSTTSDVLDVKARALAHYFEHTWIAGDFLPALSSHFGHCGPRTTSITEGFHNSMNTRFGIPHPSVRLFLDWLQKLQFEIQCRQIQLEAGRPAKQRLPVYATLEADIASAKLRYHIDIGRAFAHTFPDPTAWSLFYRAMQDYLTHMSHLIGA